MKKVFFLSLIASTLALSSCGEHKTEEVPATTTDSTQVVVDTTSVDTIAVAKDTIVK